LSVVKKHKQVAVKAAADAAISVTKVANFLIEMLGSFNKEIANTRWNSLQFQVGICIKSSKNTTVLNFRSIAGFA
jgi:hypothetical protein